MDTDNCDDISDLSSSGNNQNQSENNLGENPDGGSFYGDEWSADALQFFKDYLAANPNATLEEAIRAWYEFKGKKRGEITGNESIGEIKEAYSRQNNQNIGATSELADPNEQNTRKNSKTQRLFAVALAIIGLLSRARGGACPAKPQRTKKANCETENENWNSDTDGNPSGDKAEENEDNKEDAD